MATEVPESGHPRTHFAIERSDRIERSAHALPAAAHAICVGSARAQTMHSISRYAAHVYSLTLHDADSRFLRVRERIEVVSRAR